MDAWVWIVIAIAAVVVIAVIAAAMARKRRSQQLPEPFGPEYGRAVEDTGDRREAERELREREKEHEELDIQPLSEAARSRYSAEWQRVQAQFVDDPEDAVRAGDRLVQQAMGERGYPVDDGDFESRAATLSVEHGDVVQDFRQGHELWQRYDAGEGSTEDLRQAMVHYRSLFERQLEGEPVAEEASRR
jgi:hemerythrin-like domain-containing protein